MSIEKAFTTGQVSHYCQVSRATVLKWIRQDYLQAYTIPGGYHRVPRSSLLCFMQEYQMPVPSEVEASWGETSLGETSLDKAALDEAARSEDRSTETRAFLISSPTA